MKNARAFTLLEVAVCTAIAATLGAMLFYALAHALRWSAGLAARGASEAAADRLQAQWEDDADTAWAIFVPPDDVRGGDNADGHEVDFFARDGRDNAIFWAYRYDATKHVLQRFAYSAPGAKPAADGDPVSLTAFSAQSFAITALEKSGSPIYSPLYANAALRAANVPLGYANRPWIAGGNAITLIRFAALDVSRDDELSSGIAPGGFTVVLNYTPSPTPSPTPAPLPTSTPTIAPLTTVPATIGFANGASTGTGTGCNGIYAYNADGSPDASDTRIGTDSNGCFTNGATVYAYEPGTMPSGAPHEFRVDKGTCGASTTLPLSFLQIDSPVSSAILNPIGLSTTPPEGACVFHTLSDDHQSLPLGATPDPNDPHTASPVMIKAATILFDNAVVATNQNAKNQCGTSDRGVPRWCYALELDDGVARFAVPTAPSSSAHSLILTVGNGTVVKTTPDGTASASLFPAITMYLGNAPLKQTGTCPADGSGTCTTTIDGTGLESQQITEPRQIVWSRTGAPRGTYTLDVPNIANPWGCLAGPPWPCSASASVPVRISQW